LTEIVVGRYIEFGSIPSMTFVIFFFRLIGSPTMLLLLIHIVYCIWLHNGDYLLTAFDITMVTIYLPPLLMLMFLYCSSLENTLSVGGEVTRSSLVSLWSWFSIPYHPRSGEVSGEFSVRNFPPWKKNVLILFVIIWKIHSLC